MQLVLVMRVIYIAYLIAGLCYLIEPVKQAQRIGRGLVQARDFMRRRRLRRFFAPMEGNVVAFLKSKKEPAGE
jgi:hypothetical protein